MENFMGSKYCKPNGEIDIEKCETNRQLRNMYKTVIGKAAPWRANSSSSIAWSARSNSSSDNIYYYQTILPF